MAKHFYIEIHAPAVRVATTWFPDLTNKGDIRELVKTKEDFAKEVWKCAEELKVDFVLW